MSITYQEAIAYSHNYATAQLGIGRTEREHIFGLCKVLEKVGEERDRFSRLFSNNCEQLGAVQEALGNGDLPESTGLEPHFVGKLKDERDALARKLAMIELVWDKCDGMPSRFDIAELHRLIIESEPHVDEELAVIRGEEGSHQ